MPTIHGGPDFRLHDDTGINFYRWVSDFAQFNVKNSHYKYHHQGSDSAVV